MYIQDEIYLQSTSIVQFRMGKMVFVAFVIILKLVNVASGSDIERGIVDYYKSATGCQR